MNRKVLLMILDGWGEGRHDYSNAIWTQGTPVIDGTRVTLFGMLLAKGSRAAVTGFTLVEAGQLSGFALLGKNIANIWPIILGTWLWSRFVKEPFAKFVPTALLGTALAPVVSYLALGSTHASMPLALSAGIVIGFALPSLSAFTAKLQNGLNLYNMGFACGLLGLMIVPLIAGLDEKPATQSVWATEYTAPMSIVAAALASALILLGLFACGEKPAEAFAAYRRLLRASGKSPSDYTEMFGLGGTLVNMGINGLAGLTYILLIGGDLNAATLGGILVVMGFSAYGKNTRTILPVMLGIWIGGTCMQYGATFPALQIGALFGTALAPVAGVLGLPYGVIAGFLHAGLVVLSGAPMSGMNLYNNGFSAGLIVIVMYPVVTALHGRFSKEDDAARARE